MDHVTPEHQKHMVTDYIRFVQRRQPNNEIRDASLLPWPKDKIAEASLWYLKTSANAAARATVSDGLLLLPYFQEGVGTQPFQNCRFDLFVMDVATLSATDREKLTASIAKLLPHLDAEKFVKLLILVQSDYKKFVTACETIENTWNSSDPVSAVPEQ